MRHESAPFTFGSFLGQVSEALEPHFPFEGFEKLHARLPQLQAEYRPWRKFRHVARELGLDPATAWRFVKMFQLPLMRSVEPLCQADGSSFVIVNTPEIQEALHTIDRAVGGGGPAVLDPDSGQLGHIDARKRLSIRTWMDEAAESSLIEGASGTRKQATDLLRSGREPTTNGERMIANNYAAMQQIKRWLNRPLDPSMLLELQTMLTVGTLEDASEAGRFRGPSDRVEVVDHRTNEAIFTPPDASQLPRRLEALCEFANKRHTDREFIHPVVKAAILHFMIGYEHPFCDGNGRTARAVFYWYALRHGYTIFEYMPISDRIRAGYARYPQAYLDTEQEGGDLTHFVLYKIDIVSQAYARLEEHLRGEEQRLERVKRLLRVGKSLNERQRLLIDHALRHPTTKYTARSHMNSSGVTAPTALADLQGLVKAKLFVSTKSMKGKELVFVAVDDLREKVEKKQRR